MQIAFLQNDSDSSCQREMELLREGLPPLGFAIKPLPRADMLAGAICLPQDALVAGEMEVVIAAMKALKIDVPIPNDYPRSLQKLLHRKIWRGTVQDLEDHFSQPEAAPLFAKPASARKLFRGRIF